jgi:hypothetical protein
MALIAIAKGNRVVVADETLPTATVVSHVDQALSLRLE